MPTLGHLERVLSTPNWNRHTQGRIFTPYAVGQGASAGLPTCRHNFNSIELGVFQNDALRSVDKLYR